MLKNPNLALEASSVETEGATRKSRVSGDSSTGASLPPSEASRHTPLVLRPHRGPLDLDLRSIWRYRELLQFLVLREIKVRYKQAALGAAWAVIQPIFAALIFTVVFGMFARVPSDGVPYALFALTAIIPWTYFAEALRRGSTGLVEDSELIRKIYFPRLVLPLAAIIAPLLDLAVSFAVLALVMGWYRFAPTLHLLLLPVFVMMSGALALALALWLGPLNVRYRDVKQIMPFLLQVWMYAAPIVYPVSIVPQKWRLLYSINPMVGIIEGFLWTLLGATAPDTRAIVLTVALTLLLLVGGLVYFRRAERSFADVI